RQGRRHRRVVRAGARVPAVLPGRLLRGVTGNFLPPLCVFVNVCSDLDLVECMCTLYVPMCHMSGFQLLLGKINHKMVVYKPIFFCVDSWMYVTKMVVVIDSVILMTEKVAGGIIPWRLIIVINLTC
uniref:Uncharacterized protein n=1 Tax=Aegilops tauschii subsp. strangulata TaxID=200361 RepID=A0A453T983_AEGTS